MPVDLESAADQACALEAAAEASPIRQIKYPLARQAREWRRVVVMLQPNVDIETGEVTSELDEGRYVIEMIRNVSPGMYVLLGPDDAMVERVLLRDGQATLHVEDPDGRQPKGLYVNYHGPDSPVIVRA